ncbi:poly-gamma-glutamate hydrolase family protein [Streptomyces sp. NBC_01571]|uniref:poly-gamma-glutamate hydrolase family protein n=1 Tax=Streptomyces sp. NBC_01571 TaxID=2975883 RepID=UPI0022581B8E|nr:poly-gamma-glutamate hydrolase family protein [Streptomyces sp. NBC_01571]MCX4572293.1 poly-gamma-glutamate hydrolase family protein [Streptomyces sp. NBC_01571]
MADLYPSYSALAAAETENVTYARRTVPVTGATWCAIAIHGGGIEVGSGEVARAVAAGLMNHYEFAGLKSSNNVSLHVTSTNFDEPTCLGIVTSSRRCLSLHGYVGTAGLAETSLGGLDTDTAERVRDELTRAGFSVIDAAQEINGNDLTNIANKTTLAAGVQIEMSNALRTSFFPNGDTSRAMRDSGQRTPAFTAYVAALRRAFSGRARMSLGAVNVSRWATVPWPSADLDVAVSLGTDKLATGGSHFLHVAGRVADTNNCYLARLALNTDQSVTLTLRKRVASTETLLATAPATLTQFTHAAGRMFRLRLKITGSTLNAKMWLDGSPEPDGWSVTTTDTSLSAAGAVGMRSLLSSANTNTLPVACSYDDFRQISYQTMTVTRGVNDVVKPQASGAPVDIASPAPVAL